MVYIEIPPSLQVFLRQQHPHPVILQIEHRAHQTVKDLAESCGIPHVEIGAYLADGQTIRDTDALHDGAVLRLETACQIPPRLPSFILDVHLTRLARYLRILGFDCSYRNDYPDEEIARRSDRENRVVLTRDRGLLKRKCITYGYWVRSQIPKTQLAEVALRYRLSQWMPLPSRCSRCNSLMHQVEKTAVVEDIPKYTKISYDIFYRCSGCGQVYWEGAHYPKIKELKDIVCGRA